MTDKQPDALRLAEQLNKEIVRTVELDMMHHQAAAELRRLHEVNAELVEALSVVIRGVPDTWEGVQKAKAILARAKEKSNADT